MRIISGSLKGRQLVSFKADHIRPTTDRVKETLFNILQNDVPDARILDLFSGTGNLGIESWSRGASYVELVESHKSSLAVIRENIKKLNINERLRVVPRDVFKYLKDYKGEPFQIVFIDPPFTQSWADECMKAIAKSAVTTAGGLVVIEATSREKLEDLYEPFALLDRRDFGDKYASIYKKG